MLLLLSYILSIHKKQEIAFINSNISKSLFYFIIILNVHTYI